MIKLDEFERAQISIEIAKFTGAILRIADSIGANRDELYDSVVKTMKQAHKNASFAIFDIDSPMPVLDAENRKVIYPMEG